MRAELITAAPVLLLAVVLGRVDLYNTDLAHHLSVGRDIVEQRGIPAGYEHAANAREEASSWNGEWLFRVIAWSLYRAGGAPALVAFRIAWLMLIGLLLIQLARPPDGSPTADAALAAVVALALAAFRLSMLRPELASYVFALAIAARLLALEHREPTRADPWVLAGLMALWANLHNMWPIGWALGAVLLRRKRTAPWFALLLVAPLLTPRPIEGITFPFQLAAMIAGDWGDYFRSFTGYASPTESRTWSAHFVAAFWLLPPVAAVACWRRRSLTGAWLLLVVVLLGTRMIRLTAFALLIAPPLLARRQPTRPWLAYVLALSVAVGWGTARWQVATGLEARPGARLTGAAYPEEALRQLAGFSPAGALFNNPNVGGAVALARPGRFRAFVDNNPQAFPPAFLDRLANVLRGRQAIDPYAEEHGIGVALLTYPGNNLWLLIARFARSPDWHLVHLDEHAVIFVRAIPGNERFADPTTSLLPQLRDADPTDDWFLPAPTTDPVPYRARGRLLRSLGFPELAAMAFRRRAELAPTASAFVELGAAYRDANHPIDAQVAFEHALTLDGDHVEALLQVALIRLGSSAPHDARPLLERALRLAPADPRIRAALDSLE